MPIRVRGTPRRLAGLISMPPDAGGVEVDVAGVAVESVSVRSLGQPEAPERSWLRLALSASTRPGEYRGTIRLGGRKEAIALEVEPRTRLRMWPPRQVLRGRAGERVGASIIVANLGNTDCLLRAVDALGLYDTAGAERAVGRTFRTTRGEGSRILERLAEELAEGYGGLARVTVDAGAGELAPGEVRELVVAFHLPDELCPGRVYEGAWALPEVNHMVRVEVAGTEPSEEVS